MSKGFHEIHCQSKAYFLAIFLDIFLIFKNLCPDQALVNLSLFCYDFWAPLWPISLDFNQKINFNRFRFLIKWTKHGLSGTLWIVWKSKKFILFTYTLLMHQKLFCMVRNEKASQLERNLRKGFPWLLQKAAPIRWEKATFAISQFQFKRLLLLKPLNYASCTLTALIFSSSAHENPAWKLRTK